MFLGVRARSYREASFLPNHKSRATHKESGAKQLNAKPFKGKQLLHLQHPRSRLQFDTYLIEPYNLYPKTLKLKV